MATKEVTGFVYISALALIKLKELGVTPREHSRVPGVYNRFVLPISAKNDFVRINGSFLLVNECFVVQDAIYLKTV